MMSVLVVVLLLTILTGGHWGRGRWGCGGGLGVMGVMLAILLACYLLGAFGSGPRHLHPLR